MQRAALYVRVSTEEQAKKGVSLGAQEEALKNYCKTFGYEVFEIYKDEGKSAKDIKGRPAMQKLLENAQENLFDIILIYKLDRFSRSLKDLVLTVEKLKLWKIDFVSLQERIETTSAAGKLMFHIISAFAEFERDVIGERTKFGMEKKSKDGAMITRPPLGYVAKDKELVVEEEGRRKVQEIFERFLTEKISINKLAKQYDYSSPGLKKLLKNKTYLGFIQFDQKWHKGTHKAIIDKSLYKNVQEKLGEYA